MVILVADDEAGLRESLQTYLSRHHEVIGCPNGEAALAVMKNRVVDLLLTDHQMPGMTGLELIRQAKESGAAQAIILMTAYASIDQAVEAIRLGADDYLVKPFDFAELRHRIQRVDDLRSWNAEAQLKSDPPGTNTGILGSSANIRAANEFVGKVANVAAPVLITGPSGSGKEIIARAIHTSGSRAKRPFVAINCASLSEQLIESELFGHEKGAFTGAIAMKPGKFELANGGTIFLDEIGELSPGIQARLLRVLQEKEFYRLGGVKQIKTDARVIAATHRPLKQMTKDGGFREDLFFRLSVLMFDLLPLSQRPEDVPVFIDFFWAKFNRELGRKLTLTKEARAALLRYAYPGNVRELQNVLERMVVLGGELGSVTADALPMEFRGDTPASTAPSLDASLPLAEQIEAFEKRLIGEALERSKGSQAKAADMLGVNRATFHYKLKKYGFVGDTSDEDKDAA